MSKLRVGINGFGRIGRVLFRAGFEKFDIVGINSLDSIEGDAHLLKYDSAHGVFNADVSTEGHNLIVNGKKIAVSKTRNPAEVPWKDLGVDLVLECTGAFKKREDFMQHISAGAKRVLVSGPAEKGADITMVYGINHESYDPSKHVVVSNASCTTNCLAPLAKVLNDTFGIEHGTMMTVHSYTNDQKILDAPHSDLRRARAAAVSMIPTTTGAAKNVGLVLPELKGLIDGISVRVPTPNVSLVDFTFTAKKDVTRESVNEALIKASEGAMKGVLAVEHNELVSVDFNGNKHSSIVDLATTMVVGPRMVKVLSWYDNETGFSNRMVDVALHMQKKGL
ncbi:type I glyceraldehyde-3-phosphate dehydrogenase [Bdellovibrio bacteriovorus]|uniref:Glyceraldehyde-3-phosphate dehydrogenase n=2 Tax=Bdellovibrio bacteriovorus TaxID=959 RepID=Q6MP20_BDEBA|nr:type I glyceraldehyde-3-phosphate dehydrogenase [Bdellovibrio bacteriovorus]AHZ86293.1 glyceraldehyde-3-phosphate dehydrogenase [Bdellovibrio bacteriovorus]ASD64490.1 type I glyceraldehyde-3-phosphate dehydrogenase [Bdellovibrio bacteriovorus]BEV67530.1 Glyceraldehyde-3-phosphate dehydrogenase [Bdellovibrio bacteriovorus]CAE78978.1 glyceraldehyde-3-phosphate dehydrogenase [Bdellovibrio bacteriovorus HD100]